MKYKKVEAHELQVGKLYSDLETDEGMTPAYLRLKRIEVGKLYFTFVKGCNWYNEESGEIRFTICPFYEVPEDDINTPNT